jgi:hypothetical protein
MMSVHLPINETLLGEIFADLRICRSGRATAYCGLGTGNRACDTGRSGRLAGGHSGHTSRGASASWGKQCQPRGRSDSRAGYHRECVEFERNRTARRRQRAGYPRHLT